MSHAHKADKLLIKPAAGARPAPPRTRTDHSQGTHTAANPMTSHTRHDEHQAATVVSLLASFIEMSPLAPPPPSLRAAVPPVSVTTSEAALSKMLMLPVAPSIRIRSFPAASRMTKLPAWPLPPRLASPVFPFGLMLIVVPASSWMSTVPWRTSATRLAPSVVPQSSLIGVTVDLRRSYTGSQ